MNKCINNNKYTLNRLNT